VKKIASGFLRKDTKAFKPDPETGKWRGAETKNGDFATIKPGWHGDLSINNESYKIEIWAFNTAWGQQSLFYKISDNKTIENTEEDYDRSAEF